MSHKIIEECEELIYNKDKVEKWFSFGLSPKYGLSSELTMYMYDLYQKSSGDGSYAGRYGCFSCQMTIHQKLHDFLNYGDNVGAKLLNWEAPNEPIIQIDTTISTDDIKPTRKKKKD